MKSAPTVVTVILVIFISSCVNHKQYLLYSEWDEDSNLHLDPDEFQSAYVHSGYFTKWSPDERPISYEHFYSIVYHAVDDDSNMTIVPDEFYRNLKSFVIGAFTENFRTWDDNHNQELSLAEFNRHIARTQIACQWDKDNDDGVTASEMAIGMFNRCDLDDSGRINKAEFDYWKYFR